MEGERSILYYTTDSELGELGTRIESHWVWPGPTLICFRPPLKPCYRWCWHSENASWQDDEVYGTRSWGLHILFLPGSCFSSLWRFVTLWCLEDDRKRGSGNMLGTSIWDGSKRGMGAAFSFNQEGTDSVDLLRPTWDCRCLQTEYSRAASWLPLPWNGGQTLLPMAVSSSDTDFHTILGHVATK